LPEGGVLIVILCEVVMSRLLVAKATGGL